jgi:hypothetical protein
MSSTQLVDHVVLLIDPLVFLSCMLLLWWTAPPLRVVRLYSLRVHLLSCLLFTGQWRVEVAPEHVQAIEKFRTGLFISLATIFGAAVLKFLYYKFFFMSLHTLG